MTTLKSDVPFPVETAVSRYDRLSAWLIATIIVLGVLVLGLATMLLREYKPFPGPPKPFDSTFVAPKGEREMVDVDSGAEFPEVKEAVVDLALFDAITEVVSMVRSGSPSYSTGERGVVGNGIGVGGRLPGPIEPGPASPVSHWEITYPLVDVDSYSAMLRFFEIDLGVVHRTTNEIWRISDVGDSNGVIESDRFGESRAIYFAPTSRQIKRWDLGLVKKTDIDLEDTLVVHFYPEALIGQLGRIEQAALSNGKTTEDINQTEFEVVPNGAGFEFRVKQILFK